ncbi:MAG: tetraacyldisaccharide 4'-kinase [Planctomycetes bacterium]|nr:tetraacyldisaccharide 4'-kinase [Planctomycetota bacterium]
MKSIWFKAVWENRPGIRYSLWRLCFKMLVPFYFIAIKIHSLFYMLGLCKSTRLPVKVISVGNITVGGTGKTPMVAYLAKVLTDKGPACGTGRQKVGILSRGYGKGKGYDDEAFDSYGGGVIRVAQPDRVSAGMKLCKEDISVIILDDGFQHRRLARDVDIVMIDSTNPFGDGWLLPGGILREPRSVLKRASLLVLTHCDLVPKESLSRLELYLSKYQKPITRTIHNPVAVVNTQGESASVESIKSKKVYGFCGIGNPFEFRDMLKGVSNLLGFEAFPDHHFYTAEDINVIEQNAKDSGAEMIITTGKDVLRLKDNASSLQFLRIEMKVISGEDILFRLLQ